MTISFRSYGAGNGFEWQAFTIDLSRLWRVDLACLKLLFNSRRLLGLKIIDYNSIELLRHATKRDKPYLFHQPNHLHRAPGGVKGQ